MSFLKELLEEAELRGIRPVEVLIEILEKRLNHNHVYKKKFK